MKEERLGSPAEGSRREEMVRRLVRDLADLARTQARLTTDLMELLEAIERHGSSRQIQLEHEAPPADNPERENEDRDLLSPVDPWGGPAEEPVLDVVESGGGEPPSPHTGEPLEAAPGPLSASAEPAEEAASEPSRTVELEAQAASEAVASRPEESTPGEGIAPAPALTATAGPAGEAEPAGDAEPARAEAPGSSIASGKPPEEEEEEEPETEPVEDAEAVVLVLESAEARVGVLWDHVAQIGSLPGPEVPATIQLEQGGEQIDLVSLGRWLHGVSSEEKYFVVLSEEGERVAIACERMLGLGPIGSASKEHGTGRIQVVRAPLLKRFARGSTPATPESSSPPEWGRTREADEERDRNGPLRALVAVRYLPARVAICRYLRGRGWQVGEAAGMEAASVTLDLGRWDALFLEAPGNGNAEEAEAAFLHRVGERGIPVIRVGSRISGYPAHGGGPALMFPFSETELDAVLASAGGRGGS